VGAGMVLTDGASKMEGVVEPAAEMLQMPVRVGIPQHITGLAELVGTPVHAPGVGLLLMGSQIEHPRRPVISAGRAGSFFNRLKEWYRGEFWGRGIGDSGFGIRFYNQRATAMAHFELMEKMAPNAIIKVVGVGGGGGNA